MLVHAGAIVTVLLFERRNPSATLAWLLALMFLPLVGLIFYVMFGLPRARQVAEKYAESAAQLRPILERHDVTERLRRIDHEMRPAAESLLALGDKLSTTPHSHGNNAEMLVDAEASYRAMIEAAQVAKDHIHVEFFIIQNDETGRRMREVLVERAKAGVEVRVMTDGVGTSLPAGFWRELTDAGGHTAVFRRPRMFGHLYRRIRREDRVDFRNHRKIVVVDGTAGFTGGINVGREYLGLDPERGYWRDTFMRIDGPAVLSLQAAFAEDWHTATGRLLEDARYYPEPKACGDYAIQVIDSGPDRRFSPISYIFAQAFASARSRLWLTSPYFVPNEAIKTGLISAGLRGVDVRLLMPLKPDHKTVYYASCSYFKPLLEGGVKIYRYTKGFVHAKTLVVDDWVGTIGSANMDMRSFHLNFELNAFVYGEKFAGELAAQFERDLGDTVPYTLDDEANIGLPIQALRSAARLFSPLM
jgi:cardiolipin synthase